MCSYIVMKAALRDSSAKGAKGWMSVDTANVYYDHPYHAPLDHALGIDFVNEAAGGRERVAVELSAESARELIKQIRSPHRCRTASITSRFFVADRGATRLTRV